MLYVRCMCPYNVRHTGGGLTDFFETCRSIQRNHTPIKRKVFSGFTHNTTSLNMTATPPHSLSHRESDATSLLEKEPSITNQGSPEQLLNLNKKYIDCNDNVIDPPLDLPPPIHLPPEDPSQITIPEIILHPTRSVPIRRKPDFLTIHHTMIFTIKMTTSFNTRLWTPYHLPPHQKRKPCTTMKRLGNQTAKHLYKPCSKKKTNTY